MFPLSPVAFLVALVLLIRVFVCFDLPTMQQGEANHVVNSAHEYDISVLKPLVEPLLRNVPPTDPEFAKVIAKGAYQHDTWCYCIEE